MAPVFAALKSIILLVIAIFMVSLVSSSLMFLNVTKEARGITENEAMVNGYADFGACGTNAVRANFINGSNYPADSVTFAIHGYHPDDSGLEIMVMRLDFQVAENIAPNGSHFECVRFWPKDDKRNLAYASGFDTVSLNDLNWQLRINDVRMNFDGADLTAHDPGLF